jgi:ureidoacrylate peracid hydrolase
MDRPEGAISRREFVVATTVGGSAMANEPIQPGAAESQANSAPVGKNVNVQAKPGAISIDTTRTAVLVVDMQNDFGAKGGMFDRAGLDISGIQSAVAPTARVLAAGRAAGLKIVYLKMGFRPDLSDLGGPEAPNRTRHNFLGVGSEVRAPNGALSRILVRDTWNTEILPELKPAAGDVVMYKHRFSGFYGTDLDATLRGVGVKDLIVTGCTTSVCVESTVRDAMFRDYRCVLLSDCMAEPIGHDFPRSNHDASLLVMQILFAWVSTSSEFVRTLEA